MIHYHPDVQEVYQQMLRRTHQWTTVFTFQRRQGGKHTEKHYNNL